MKTKAGSECSGEGPPSSASPSRPKPIGLFFVSSISAGANLARRGCECAHSGPDPSLSLFISCLARNHPVSAKGSRVISPAHDRHPGTRAGQICRKPRAERSRPDASRRRLRRPCRSVIRLRLLQNNMHFFFVMLDAAASKGQVLT